MALSLFKKLAILIIIFCSLGIGLGAGLGVGLKKRPSSSDETITYPTDNFTESSNLWIPAVGSTWDYHLESELNEINDEVDIYDLDLFDNSIDIIQELHKSKRRVICYFSAGSYENWRNDSLEFEESDLGDPLDGWEGERWVNISSSNVRRIMRNRINLASSKGCDAIDPDNVDGYSNKNGLGLTKNDSINFINYLSEIAHNLNISIGLKNANDIVDDVVNIVEFSVQEQCVYYQECDNFRLFIENDKAVFHVEYPKGDKVDNNKNVSLSVYDKYCNDKSASRFSSILKNMNLDNWLQLCKS